MADPDIQRVGILRSCGTCDHPPGMHKCCPQCGESADGEEQIDEIFGFRTMKPEDEYQVPQTWCRECRRLSLYKGI